MNPPFRAYPFDHIEDKWREYWRREQTFEVEEDSSRPKYYVLDMFPYPSGEGLHVGHPLGYIASDIYARYKRLKGFNVLHPMGYDAFGLPAEQYAIQTGKHPAATTAANIERYRQQLDRLGLSFAWSREVQTCDPTYYRWTQWAFQQMFNSYFDPGQNKARPISELIPSLEKRPNWQAASAKEREEILQNHRLAYLAPTPVNWCPELGTVLANDEVKDGLSVRGGFPVEQKIMRQWCLRTSAYAQRLLEGLNELDWPNSLKDMQRHWIGRSEGLEVRFAVEGHDASFDIFTTRPDTLFGATFVVLSPESPWAERVATAEQLPAVKAYLKQCRSNTQRQRMSEAKSISGCPTGAFCRHPLSGEKIPIWVGDYVLGGYGTGAIMAVPAHDQRDHDFARHFQLPIVPVVSPAEGPAPDARERPYEDKEGVCHHSDFLNGLRVPQAIERMNAEVEKRGIGVRKINYRLRDAIFSRQRYWGEPFPVYFQDGVPRLIPESELPLELPAVDAYLPTGEGEPPLARAKDWTYRGHPLELSTMPGFAGSSAYYLRYMDPHNSNQLVGREANRYWQSVDLYVGGSEHATGHLIYSRFWNLVLYDLGHVCRREPFAKLVNQGMIQGRSNLVYRLKNEANTFVSKGLLSQYPPEQIQTLHVDVGLVDNDKLDCEAFKKWRPEFEGARFLTEEKDGESFYLCGHSIEKMSKSLYNVVNPDAVIERYGADTLRLYEMFLGPIEQSKPWNTNGIEGMHRFLAKFWNALHRQDQAVSEEAATPNERKILHTCIKKVSLDIENFAFNTAISALMVAVGQLAKASCHKREIWEPLVIALSPFAPHVAEELWQYLGHAPSITTAKWPTWDESLLREDTYSYPVSFNGKTRFLLELPRDLGRDEIQRRALEDARTQKWIGGRPIKKVVVVPHKIVNFVC